MKQRILGVLRWVLASLLIVQSANAFTYSVKRGDTVSGIAARYNATVKQIQLDNQLVNPNRIFAGQNLEVNASNIGAGHLIGAAAPLPEDNYDKYISVPVGISDTVIYVSALPTYVSSSIYTIFAGDGRTVSEKIYCSGTAQSGTVYSLIGCVRGLALGPSGGVINETGGTGVVHSKNSRIAITDTSNFSGKALAILNGSQSTGSNSLIVGPGSAGTTKIFIHNNSATSSDGYLYGNASGLGWSDDGVSTFLFKNGSSGLTASTTAGIGVSNSQIYVNASTTGGLGFDSNGKLTIPRAANSGIGSDATGLFVQKSDPFAWTGTQSFGASTTFTATTTFSGPVTGAEASLFGDGSDGDVSISAGTTSTITRDMYYKTLNVPATAAIVSNGYHIFASIGCTVNGRIAWDGNAGGTGGVGQDGQGGGGATGGTAGTGGTALTSGSLYGSKAGTAGVAGANSSNASNGTTGTTGLNGDSLGSVFVTIGNAGVGGGAGGIGVDRTAGAAGAGGSAGTIASSTIDPTHNSRFALPMFDFGMASSTSANIKATGSNGGAGGGATGGGYSGGNSGGAGGGGGGAGSNAGNVIVACRTFAGSGSISAQGGRGGTGGAGGAGRGTGAGSTGAGGGGGGGAGGGGGFVGVLYTVKTFSGSYAVNGGAGGTAGAGGVSGNGGTYNGANGTTGATGPNGKSFEIQI